MNRTEQEALDKKRGGIRNDLIRRLFAVAISVGAAATLAEMPWIKAPGRAPCFPEYQQLSILIAAMYATVLSWDGYLLSIDNKPLRNFWRFAIDIFLVFVYMFLLMTSKLLVWWTFLHAFIFVLYVIWDALTIRDWPSKYFLHDSGPQTVMRAYVGGFRNSAEINRGPIVTLFWGLYFWVLYFASLNSLRDRILGTTVFVLVGLWAYRKDKRDKLPMWKRFIWVLGLSVASVAYAKWGITDLAVWNRVGPYIGSASCTG
jgi:hypothetical protein